MVDGVKGFVRLVVGVAVVFALFAFLRSTNIVAESMDYFAVQDGRVSASAAPVASTALEIGLSVVSAVVFVLTKVGEGAIAVVSALFGVATGSKPASAVQPVAFNVDTLEVLLPQYEQLTAKLQQLELFAAAKAKDADRLAFLANQIAGVEWVDTRVHVVGPAAPLSGQSGAA